MSITRTPGRGKQRAPVVYRGRASSFRDTRLQPGVTYRYQLAVTDAAGNTNDVSVAVLVPTLYLPAAGARVKAGDLLAWAPVKGASYYNVQIYRGSRKVLSVWPKQPRLKLPRTWSFDGKHRPARAGALPLVRLARPRSAPRGALRPAARRQQLRRPLRPVPAPGLPASYTALAERPRRRDIVRSGNRRGSRRWQARRTVGSGLSAAGCGRARARGVCGNGARCGAERDDRADDRGRIDHRDGDRHRRLRAARRRRGMSSTGRRRRTGRRPPRRAPDPARPRSTSRPR